MGVRLVIHNYLFDEVNYTGTHNHDEMIHRDLPDQHPIYAISGLQEVLNTIESNVLDILNTIVQQRTDLISYTDNSISDAVDILNDRIDGLNLFGDVIDTNSIDLTYGEDKHLRADVKLYDDTEHTNALILTEDGLYVQKLMTKETSTITWGDISFGMTLSELFTDGIRFSHQNTASYDNMYNSTEAEAWTWDSTLNSILQPLDTTSYNGIVTTHLYDNYQHSVRLLSTGTDNGANGVVIGFVFDENGYPHTLSAMIQRAGNVYLSYRFAIIYNFRLLGETLVSSYNLTNSSGSWDAVPEGITLYITKNKNLISVSATSWGYVNNNIAMIDAENMTFEKTLNINLDSYTWGHYFKEKVRYGYSNLSQANSYFDHVLFYSKDKHSIGDVSANVKIDEDYNNNALKVTNSGLFVQKFLISERENNALSEESDGYYVEVTPVSISDKRLNGFEDTGSGHYYVHKSHSFIEIEQTAHNFIVGDFIYYDNRTSLYQKALAKDDFDINIVGMITYIIDEDNFEYVCSGYVETDLFTTDNGFIQGMPLYISDIAAGEVTQEQPDISKAVGYPVGDVGLIISIERGIQYNQEADIGDFKTSANDYNIRSDGFIKVAENIDFKYSLIHRLVERADNDFKENYLVIDQETNSVSFQNIEGLYTSNNVPIGLNLFIKAF